MRTRSSLARLCCWRTCRKLLVRGVCCGLSGVCWYDACVWLADPVLESVLLRQVIKVGGVSSIRLGDSTVEYDPGFRLYITTKLRNPHYPPETCVKVNLLNFMATAEGLEEVPELERQREKLILEDAENKKQLKKVGVECVCGGLLCACGIC